MANIIKELLNEIKTGTAVWTQSWATGTPINAITKAPYKGYNIWGLLYSQMKNGFTSNEWAGYIQWKKAGYQVAKGARGTDITVFMPPKVGEDGEVIRRGFFKSSFVFNREQTDAPKLEAPDKRAWEEADDLIWRLNLTVLLGDPAYSPKKDAIIMPSWEQFTSGEEYYSAFFHELTHWTGHKTRLNRPGIVDEIHFGSEKYAREELIAEIGSCLLANFTHTLSEKSKANSAAYLRSWLKSANEPDVDRAIINALEEARRAYQFVRGI